MPEIVINISDESAKLLGRLAAVWGNSVEDEAKGIVEAWLQAYRDKQCECDPDERDENYDPEVEGYCSHGWV